MLFTAAFGWVMVSVAYGDVAPFGNRDGTVNVGDALVILRKALGIVSF